MAETSSAIKKRTGSCLCGDVQYEVIGEMREIIACHCIQCRKTSGHFVAATAAAKKQITIKDAGALTWYQSSASTQRGFCQRCGSSLSWKHRDRDSISIHAGALNPPTGLKIAKHIFVKDKGDYYDV